MIDFSHHHLQVGHFSMATPKPGLSPEKRNSKQFACGYWGPQDMSGLLSPSWNSCSQSHLRHLGDSGCLHMGIISHQTADSTGQKCSLLAFQDPVPCWHCKMGISSIQPRETKKLLPATFQAHPAAIGYLHRVAGAHLLLRE